VRKKTKEACLGGESWRGGNRGGKENGSSGGGIKKRGGFEVVIGDNAPRGVRQTKDGGKLKGREKNRR